MCFLFAAVSSGVDRFTLDTYLCCIGWQQCNVVGIGLSVRINTLRSAV